MTRLLRQLRRRVAAPRDDGGVSLVESVVGLMIASLVFSAIAASMMQMLHSSVLARQHQHAADLLSEQVEFVRSLDYPAIEMVTSDLAGDPRLTDDGGGGYLFDPGTGTPEAIVSSDVGLIADHIKDDVRNNTTYVTSRYVTAPVDVTGADYRRFTVIVEWFKHGKTHTRRSSTMLVDTRRGLPLPRYKLSTSTAATASPGGTLGVSITLTNQGARDGFNLTMSDGNTWAWYIDANSDGVYDPAVDVVALTDFDLDGKPDTGQLEPNEKIKIIAVRSVGLGESGTSTLTLTATSIAQPSAETATATRDISVTITSSSTPTPTPSSTSTPTPGPTPTPTPTPSPSPTASCTGCNMKSYYLHNTAANNADSVALSGMPLNQTAPTGATLWNYATDVMAGVNGRYVVSGGSGASETDKSQVADWRYQVPTASTYNGTATVKLYAYMADGSTVTNGQVTVQIGNANNTNVGTFTLNGTGVETRSPWGSSSFLEFTVAVPVTNLSVAANKYLVIRAQVTGASDMRLAYDTVTYAAVATMPAMVGG